MRTLVCSVVIAAFAALAIGETAFAGRLAFAAHGCEQDGCRYRIWTVDDSGRDLRRLTGQTAAPTLGYGGIDEGPSWSPDGRKLVFSRLTPGSQADGIYTIGADGAGLRRIVPGGAAAHPDWSPREDLIALESGDAGVAGVYTIRGDGSGRRRVVSGKGYLSGPRFSSDGRTLTYFRAGVEGTFIPGTGRETGLYSVDLTTGRERRLTFGLSVVPEFSPDGRWAAFHWKGRLFTMRTDGRQLREWTELGERALYLTWSEGNRLFFGHQDDPPPDGQSSIWSLDPGAADGDFATLTSKDEWIHELDWTDGTPPDPPVDRSPPYAVMFDGGSGARASRTRVPTIRRREYRLLAGDSTGIRRVKVAVVRRVRRGRKRLCRFAKARGFTRPRSCRRAVMLDVRSDGDLRRRLLRLRAGRYAIGFKARDVRGNATRRLRVGTVRLR